MQKTMKRHKQYIAEWKSVNDDIKKVAEDISKIMWNISSKDKKQTIDKVVYRPFVGGNFVYDLSKYPQFGIDSINVVYKIYFFDGIDDYNIASEKIGNSEYNSDTNTLYIRVGLVEGYFNHAITQEVFHELTHAFEYSKGMEKRTDLYDVAMRLINGEYGEFGTIVGKLIYYTFSHEQDAFAHQFYGLISSERYDEPFDVMIWKCKNYADFYNSRMCYKEYYKREKKVFDDIFSMLGMNAEQFNKRIHFGGIRFKRKLQRVYQRHMYENRKRNLGIKESLRQSMIDQLIIEEYKKRYKNLEYEDEKDFVW